MIEAETKLQIEEYLENWYSKIIEKVKIRSSNVKAGDFRPTRDFSNVGNIKPFQEAFLTEGILRGNELERSLSTTLGTSYEKCAEFIALQNFPTVKTQYRLTGQAYEDTILEIAKIKNNVDTHGSSKNYLDLVKTITSIKGKKTVEISVISDLYVKDDNDNEGFWEMKAPKPNKDQCLAALEKGLKIHAITIDGPPKVKTFCSMAYNPWGKLKNNYKHSFALRYLDMENQVQLGKEFWDYLGGEGTNDEIIGIYRKVGLEKVQDLLE